MYRSMQSSFCGESGHARRLRAMAGGVLQERRIASHWPVLGKLLLPTHPSARYIISMDKQGY